MIEARPYQAESGERAWNDLVVKDLPSTLVVLPTGTGKTVLFGLIARRWIDEKRAGRILVLAHREELIRQAKAELDPITGVKAEIEMAGESANTVGSRSLIGNVSPVVVASVQTLCSGKRIERFDPTEFGLIVTDECHHSPARSYKRIYEYFPTAKLLGVTATPKRADELALGKLFGNLSYEMGIKEAVDAGWLAPVEQRYVVVEELDLSAIKTVGDDFSQSQLGHMLTGDRILDQMVAATVELCGEEPTLIFTAPRSAEDDVSQGEIFADALNKIKPGKAIFLSGETHKDIRRMELEQFNLGNRQYLLGCGLFTEGFNAPQISRVVMARVTKSLVYYMQAIGRGTRTLRGVLHSGLTTAEERKAAIAASAKPGVLVIDFVGNSGRHKLISAVDIFAGKAPQKVIDKAKELGKKPTGRTVDELLTEAAKVVGAEEAAARDLAERKERMAQEKRDRKKARLKIDRVKLNQRDVDPYERSDGFKSSAGTPGTGGATEEQRQWVITHGGFLKPDASAGDAGAMISDIKKRWAANLCSPKQERVLKRNGMADAPIPKLHAKALLDYLNATNWRAVGRPKRSQLAIVPESGKGFRLAINHEGKVIPVGEPFATPEKVREVYQGLNSEVA